MFSSSVPPSQEILASEMISKLDFFLRSRQKLETACEVSTGLNEWGEEKF
jgi:hypothetical protein